MLFNSYIFVLLFLPVCIIGYFTLNHFRKYLLGQAFLVGMSLWFYGYFNLSYLWIMLFSILLNFSAYRLLNRTVSPLSRKLILFLAIALNLGILFYFKYFDFFLENINAIFQAGFSLQHILLPLGISFFTFQQLSFVIDAYRGEVSDYSFLYYVSFVTYFPQLIAGPIVTHDELIPQFLDLGKKRFNWDHFAQGTYLFVMGLSKKVLLADVFGNAANWGFSNIGALDSTNALLTVLAYTIQIYFDFSGYCDMAVGIGRMMNLELPVNFNSPYKSLTILEFWERWHITLTRFFTKYIYIPLGGSRKGAWRTYRNVMIVFLISGLWHGASYTFILWGALHGLFSVLTRWKRGFFEKLHPALNWIITFSFINVTWIFFRADSIHDALRILKRICNLDFQRISTAISSCFDPFFLRELCSHIPGLGFLNEQPGCNWFLAAYFLLAFLLILGPRNLHQRMKVNISNVSTITLPPRGVCTISQLLLTAVFLVLCIFSFSSVSTFLYFNF